MELIFLLILIAGIYSIVSVYRQKQSERKRKLNRPNRPAYDYHSTPITSRSRTAINSSSSSQILEGALESGQFQKQIRLLEWAIQSKQSVQFDYEEGNGSKNTKTVTPIKFKAIDKNPVLEGYCYSEKAERIFTLNRIENVWLVSINTEVEHSTTGTQSTVKDSKLNDKVRQRPYKNYSFDELEKLARSSWSNLKLLDEIYYELEFRSHKKTQTLRQQILKKLTQTSNPPFVWPPTTVGNGTKKPVGDIFRPEEGLLKYCGYKVGADGLPENQRRQILDEIFLQPLPYMSDSSYLSEWGEPNTYKRLRKLAESLAAFTRNAKRRKKGDFSKAIQEWESDLAYLKRNFYDNDSCFYFKWPSSK